jgi:hypothetical protein
MWAWLDVSLAHEKTRLSCEQRVLGFLILEANDEKVYFIAITVDI